jgi:hypothetical protein
VGLDRGVLVTGEGDLWAGRQCGTGRKLADNTPIYLHRSCINHGIGNEDTSRLSSMTNRDLRLQ